MGFWAKWNCPVLKLCSVEYKVHNWLLHIILYYTTPHYTTLHYTTPHYTTLHTHTHTHTHTHKHKHANARTLSFHNITRRNSGCKTEMVSSHIFRARIINIHFISDIYLFSISEQGGNNSCLLFCKENST